jgi:multidrug efflux system outer membrane protein
MNMNLKKNLSLGLCALLFSSTSLSAQTKPVVTEKSTVPATKTVEQSENDEVTIVKSAPDDGVTVYTLSEAIKRALTISPLITSAQYDQEISEAQLQEANAARFLTKLDMNLLGGMVPDIPQGSGPENNFPDVNTSISNLGPFMQVRVDGFQPLYTFGKISGLRKAAMAGLNAKEEGVQKARNELIWQIKRVYTSLTYLYSLQEFLQDIESRSGKAKDVIDKMLLKRNSSVTEVDRLRVGVFQAETERRLIEVNNNIDFALMTLKVLMGLPRATKIDIANQRLFMDKTVIAPIESYIQIAKENRPEIVQLTNLVEVREGTLKSTRANFYPTLGLAGFYRFGWAPDRQDLKNPFLVDDFNTNSGGGFLVLNQNLSFHMTNARSNQAKAQYDKAVADQLRALQGIEIEIRKAHNNSIMKQQAVDAAERGFKMGRGWVLAATLGFGVGTSQSKDLIDAFVGYSAVRFAYLQTLSDYYIALADLSNAIGQEVTDLKY